jgi:hypothetical protein
LQAGGLVAAGRAYGWGFQYGELGANVPTPVIGQP